MSHYNNTESGLIFDISPFEGEWKIEFIVKKNFKAMDGTTIELGNLKKKYRYTFTWGPDFLTSGYLIDFS